MMLYKLFLAWLGIDAAIMGAWVLICYRHELWRSLPEAGKTIVLLALAGLSILAWNIAVGLFWIMPLAFVCGVRLISKWRAA